MSRHHGIGSADVVYVARRQARTEVLGPGLRSAVWVQGCHLRCRGCVAAETHPLVGGEPVPAGALGRWLAEHAVDGVTVSGGEPMLQAIALVATIDVLRELRPRLSMMIYTGYRVEWLQREGNSAQRALISRADLLVDGPYVERWHAALRWRGSSNQRLLDLSGRHTADLVDDEPAGLELELDGELGLLVTGVPPMPRFRDWVQALAD